MRVKPPKPRARKIDLYAGYAVRVTGRTDVLKQYECEMLEGPLRGEYRWFKVSELDDESGSIDRDTVEAEPFPS